MDRLPHTLTATEIEAIEKMSMRITTQALLNFAANAWDEFRNSPDDADGVAEDVTKRHSPTSVDSPFDKGCMEL